MITQSEKEWILQSHFARASFSLCGGLIPKSVQFLVIPGQRSGECAAGLFQRVGHSGNLIAIIPFILPIFLP